MYASRNAPARSACRRGSLGRTVLLARSFPALSLLHLSEQLVDVRPDLLGPLLCIFNELIALTPRIAVRDIGCDLLDE